MLPNNNEERKFNCNSYYDTDRDKYYINNCFIKLPMAFNRMQCCPFFLKWIPPDKKTYERIWDI